LGRVLYEFPLIGEQFFANSRRNPISSLSPTHADDFGIQIRGRAGGGFCIGWDESILANGISCRDPKNTIERYCATYLGQTAVILG
jgi:hypothetical protein